MVKYSILVIDDDEENLASTRGLLQRWGYDVDVFTSGNDALECMRATSKDYAVALVDFQMPGKNGAETAAEMRTLNKELVILIHTAYPSFEAAKATIRAGVLNYIEKDEDIEYLKQSMSDACEQFEKVRTTKASISVSDAEKIIAESGMAGRSVALAQVISKARLYSTIKKPVLILGETGVGKEIISKIVHGRHDDSFFAINCAAFEDSSLIDSELFGYEKGAFTGALQRKAGIFEVARGGTVFLDELHHLPLGAQAKLLRAIREKKVRRVGAHQEVDVDFKLIAATRPNIENKVAEGSFLPDLYYRIKFLSIEIPPLRERPEDIEPLIVYFCEKHFKESGQKKTFLVRTVNELEKYSWPGNIGELDGYVSALLTNSTRDTIDVGQLDRKYSTASSVELSTFAQLEEKQELETKAFIISSLQSSKNIRQTAEKIGMKPSSLHTLLDRLGIKRREVS